MRAADRLLLVLAATAGLLGVALSAAAAHVSAAATLDTAARFLLVHAAALVGLSALTGSGALHRGAGLLAGAVLVAGLALFCGDLTDRALAGTALFPLAAPTGGILLMLGWAVLAAAALWPTRPR